ncbi:FAD-binding oxidoreductase [Acaryochloris sp. CCMEE 5410]|uniref:NAD(P)/FAD-dependent oxidoreductase n=1 Tax=Acaryochloris sp. CCMEE 5410 TaxID=310037 RepID=UPI0002484435|nr:FAD-dependent oxidoreductase [Acaryochloris sp. CCMEE 5410]KAI9131754.1 FAD-binding oxidoreductase [Acaryochloris sp. CCMEE 5410]
MRIGIIGCGVVGAAIAFELSQTHQVTVWDARSPHQWQATGAALGVLMAAITPKLKGKHLQLRLDSLKFYDTLIPKLEAITKTSLPYNQQGILRLCFDGDELSRWSRTQQVRAQQGFQLEILDQGQLFHNYPHLSAAHLRASKIPVVGAIFSSQDRQIDPVALSVALIAAAQNNGAEFYFDTPISGFKSLRTDDPQSLTHVCSSTESYPLDWVIVSAGLGSTALTTTLHQPVPIYPVLGQALHLKRQHPLVDPLPVVNGDRVHIVPLNASEVWVGATVEFPSEVGGAIEADPIQLKELHQRAIALDASLAHASILRTWSGLRPRPHERPAPIIERLPGYDNVVVASGHYRNGVLLAPITAQKVRQLISN